LQHTILLHCWNWHVPQQYTQNALFLFHFNDGNANALQYYVLNTLRILLNKVIHFFQIFYFFMPSFLSFFHFLMLEYIRSTNKNIKYSVLADLEDSFSDLFLFKNLSLTGFG
jgi:hypothetical protein